MDRGGWIAIGGIFGALALIVALLFASAGGNAPPPPPPPAVTAPPETASYAKATPPAPSRSSDERVRDMLLSPVLPCSYLSISLDKIRLALQAYPELTDSAIEDLACGHITIGMDKAKVVIALGYPTNVNTTQTAHSSSEQWVYGNDYIYLENGRVTSWQTSR
jgi:hypothetical protein